MTPVEFLRSRDWHPGLLCCTPAIAWLQFRCVDLTPVHGRLGSLWRTMGVAGAADEIARLIGLAEAAHPQSGDIALVDVPPYGPAFALWCGSLAGLVTTEGRPIFAAMPPLKAWRVP